MNSSNTTTAKTIDKFSLSITSICPLPQMFFCLLLSIHTMDEEKKIQLCEPRVCGLNSPCSLSFFLFSKSVCQSFCWKICLHLSRFQSEPIGSEKTKLLLYFWISLRKYLRNYHRSILLCTSLEFE